MKRSRLWYGFISLVLSIGVLATIVFFTASHFLQSDDLPLEESPPHYSREDPEEVPLPEMEIFQDL